MGVPQFLQQLELGHVGILVLVHQDDPEALPETVAHFRKPAQDFHRLLDQVAEVGIADAGQPFLVEPIAAAEFRPVVDQVQRRILRGQKIILGPGDQVGRMAELRPGRVGDDGAQQGDHIVVVVDDEVGIQADQRPVAPEEPGAEGMEGAQHGPFGAAVDAAGPGGHFPGRLVGEGDRQDGLRGHAPFPDQVGDFGGDDPGLARPRAGQDQQRRRPGQTAVQHRPALFGVQGPQILRIVHGRRRPDRIRPGQKPWPGRRFPAPAPDRR